MADEEKKEIEGQEVPEQPESSSAEVAGAKNGENEVPEQKEENGEVAVSESEEPIEGVTPDEPVEEVKPEEAAQKIEAGMVVRVHVKIKDVTPRGDERERIQVFEGTVIARKGRNAQSATITVRKVSNGIGVERIFPLMMPAIDKIEIVKKYRTRRSKLYFLRGKFKKRLKEVPVEKK